MIRLLFAALLVAQPLVMALPAQDVLDDSLPPGAN